MDEQLKELWLFAQCTPRQLRAATALGTHTRVLSGSRLLTEGAPGREVLVAVSGSAVCTVGGTVVALFGRGDFFGEVGALDGRPRTATVEAVTDMDVVVFDHREFDQLLELSPTLALRVLQVAARRLRQANDLMTAA